MKRKTSITKIASILTVLAMVWGGGVACQQPTEPEAPVEPTKYTISFDSGIESITVEDGAVATEPTTAPEKTGYTFGGWLNDEAAYDWTQPVTSNLSLTAKWTAVEYTITYLPEGVETDNPPIYTIETETFALADPKNAPDATKPNFVAWHVDSEEGAVVTEIAKGSTGNKTFYAEFSAEKPCVVKFMLGTEEVKSINVKKDTKITLPTGFEKYSLFSDSDCTKAFDTNTAITADTTIYVKLKTFTISYKVLPFDKVNPVEGETNGSLPAKYGKVFTDEEINALAEEIDGYAYKGVFTDEACTVPFDNTKAITSDLTVYVLYEEVAEEPETPAIPTTVAVTKNEDGSFSFADGTYTFVIDGPNPVLKFSMPEEVSCTIGDKLKLTGKINFGDTAVYKQFYIQTNDTAGVPLFGYNMLAEWNNGLSGDQTLSLSQTIPDKIGDVTYCTSFKDCKFVLSSPKTTDDKTLINVTFSNVKMTYEKVDPNAVVKEDISLAASFWGWGYSSEASNADDGSLIITNTAATGAGSFGYNPTKDWSGYKTLEIVLGDQTEWKGATWAQVTIQNEKDAEGKQPSVNGSIDVSKTTQTIVIDLETASATIDLTKISQIAVQSGAADSVIQVTACYLTK